MDFVAGLKENVLFPFFILNVKIAFKVYIFNDFGNIICLMSLQQIVLFSLPLQEQKSEITEIH